MHKLFLTLFSLFTLNGIAQFQGAWVNDNTPTPGEVHTYKTLGFIGDRPNYDWADLEPTKGAYTAGLTTMRNHIKLLSDSGLYIQIEIEVGPDAPLSWLHNVDGVDTFYTTGGGFTGTNFGPYPDYYNANYKLAYNRFYSKVDSMLETLTTNEKIYFKNVFVVNGSTGDKGPYKGTPINSSFGVFDDATWKAYVIGQWDTVYSYMSNNSFMTLEFNQGNDFEDNAFCRVRYPGCWLKWGDISHIYPIDGEKYRPIIPYTIFAQETQNYPTTYGIKDIQQLMISALSLGSSVTHFPGSFLGLANIDSIVQFVNTYALQLDTTTATKGFCALAEKIIIDDTITWSQITYGNLITNVSGYNSAISTINAGSEDELHKKFKRLAKLKQFTNTTRIANLDAYDGNDANYEPTTNPYNMDFVWVGNQNFNLNVIQKDILNTSFGVYRFGSSGSRWGRNGRKFKLIGGKGAMWFDILDGIQNTGALDSLKIQVTYQDTGYATWGVYGYNQRCRKEYRVGQVNNTNTGNFLTKTFIAPKFKWGNHMLNQSDFAIKLLAGENFAITIVEIERLN